MPIDRIAIPVSGGEQPLVVAAPDGDAALPYLLIAPSIFGIADDLVGQMQELAADAVVVGVDPFWRVSPGALPYDDCTGAVARMNELDRQASFADWLATIDWARAQPRCNAAALQLLHADPG